MLWKGAKTHPASLANKKNRLSLSRQGTKLLHPIKNEEIAKLGDTAKFADLAEIDKKLGLPRGTSFECGGYADYFAS
jgi:hypothetical protein